MLNLGCAKSVNWASSGTFILLFCIWCYSKFTHNVMLAVAVTLPSYANAPSSWNSTTTSDILISQGNDSYPSFTLGFIKTSTRNRLAIYFYRSPNDVDPTFVWSSRSTQNEYLFDGNVTLELTVDGVLELNDETSGINLWSIYTDDPPAVSMRLKDDGNLVLLNGKGDPVWESFSNPSPTNTLLNVKQGLHIGQRLTSSTSAFNLTGNYYIEWSNDGLLANVDFINPPRQYKICDYENYNYTVSRLLQYDNQQGYLFSFLFLDLDGQLKWVGWNHSYSNISVFWNDCSYPMTCGKYGICVNEKKCSCPIGKEGSLNYFQPVNQYNISLGCTLVTPLSCSEDDGFLELEQVAYFDNTPALVEVDVEA